MLIIITFDLKEKIINYNFETYSEKRDFIIIYKLFPKIVKKSDI